MFMIVRKCEFFNHFVFFLNMICSLNKNNYQYQFNEIKKFSLVFSSSSSSSSPCLLTMFVLLSLVVICNYYSDQLVWAHSILGGNDAGINGTQTQRNGNYVVELFINPTNPLVDKNTDIFLRIVSNTGDELIELPVSVYILKDGKPIYSNPDNYTFVKQGHYNFNYVFDEPGQYLLFVDVKDIFYTLNVLNFIFEINVDLPLTDKIIELLRNYYYVYIPLIIIAVVILLLKYDKTRKLKIRK